MNPIVSIILPTYNGNNYIKTAINSVLKQTFENFELIIIDDCSTDKELFFTINEYRKKDPRIKYFRNEKNIKIIKSLNFGISVSTGKYIARIDDDDEWIDEKKLEKQINILENNPSIALVGTNAKIIGMHNNFIKNTSNILKSDDIKKHIIANNQFLHSSVVFKKSILNNSYYKDSIFTKHVEDYELWLRIASNNEIVNMSDIALAYKINDSGISSRNFYLQKLNGFITSLKYVKYFKNSFYNIFIRFLRLFIPKKLSYFFRYKSFNINKNTLNTFLNKYRIFILYVVFFILYLFIFFYFTPYNDLIGRHSWDEATYLNVADNKNISFFNLNPLYDNSRPDFNNGFYLYYLTILLKKIFNIFSDQTPLVFYRSISIFFTFISTILIYKILTLLFNSDKNKKITAFFTSLLFLFSPLVLWYGSKFKLEPFVFFLFFCSIYFYIKSYYRNKISMEFFSMFIFGSAVINKNNILFLLPLFFINNVLRYYKNKNIFQFIKDGLFLMLSFLSGLTLPILFIDIYQYFVYGKMFAHNFIYYRIIGYKQLSESFDPNSGEILVLFLKNTFFKTFSFYGIALIFSLFFLKKEKNTYLKIFFYLLLILSLFYFTETLPHNSNHDYHAYYFIFPSIISFYLLFKNINKRFYLCFLTLILIGINFYLSYSIFGMFKNNFNDPHGNLNSINGGKYIKEIYDKYVFDNSYVLIDSPVVSFYSKKPSLGYSEFYIFKNNINWYVNYDYNTNCIDFWNNSDIFKPISIIYGDPNVIAKYYNNKKNNIDWCIEYLKNNFKEINIINNNVPIYIRNKYYK